MKPTMKTILLSLLIFVSLQTFSQSGIGIGTETPHPSAIVDMESGDQGLLIPRMTTAERLGISSPAEGLMVFDTDEASFFYFTGGTWLNLLTANDSFWQANGTDIYNTNAGSVGIGTDDPESILHIMDSLNPTIRFETPSQQIIVGIDETEGVFEIGNDSIIFFEASNDGNLYLQPPSAAGSIYTDAMLELPSFRLIGASPGTSALSVDATGMVNYISQPVVDLYNTDSIEIPEIYTDMIWQVQRLIDSAYTHSPGSAEIIINETGTYEINTTIGINLFTESHSAASNSILLLDAGTGYNVIPGSRLDTWHNHDVAGVTANRKIILELNAGDRIKLQSRRLTNKELYKTIAGYSINLTKLIR